MPQPITREGFVAELAALPPEALRGLLQATGYGAGSARSSAELAHRIAACLWWSWSTPLGYAARRASLDTIVDDVAARLELSAAIRGGTDAWGRLYQLQAAALDSVESASLDEALRDKLGGPSRFPSIAGVGGAGGAYGAGRVGAWVLRLGAGPVGRLLPLIPALAPYWRVIRGVAAITAALGTPLSIGLGVLSVNHALGSNYRRLVPLLLGAGALRAAGSDAGHTPPPPTPAGE